METLLFFILAVITGLMFTFFGYAFFRFLLPIWGFFAGLSFGFRGLEDIMGPGFLSASLGLLLGIVLGVVLAAVAYSVYALAIYLFGITMGYVLGAGLMLALGFEPGLMTFLAGGAAALGLLVLFTRTKMPRFLLIFFTAVGGSMAVLTGIFVLFGAVPSLAGSLQLTKFMVSGSFFWLMIWIVLASFGVVFQYATASMSEDDLSSNYDWEKEYTELPKASKKK